MSLGLDHVLPSSVLELTNTRLVSWLVFLIMSPSASSPRFQVINNQMVPVSSSKTGVGLPHTLLPSSQIITCSPQVFPPSVERRISRSISPVSDELFFLPSAKARTVPPPVTIMEGIL